MIGLLEGTVFDIQGRLVTLLVGGVGYELQCSKQCLERLEPRGHATVTVHTDVREDDIRLFGFESREERQVFLLLSAVNSLGKKMALDIVSYLDAPSLFRAIGAGDIEQLQRVPGIGKKRAERIVVELKDKVAEFATELLSPAAARRSVTGTPQPSLAGEAVEALIVLGFPRRDAERAVQSAAAKGAILSTGELVREALQFI